MRPAKKMAMSAFQVDLYGGLRSGTKKAMPDRRAAAIPILEFSVVLDPRRSQSIQPQKGGENRIGKACLSPLRRGGPQG